MSAKLLLYHQKHFHNNLVKLAEVHKHSLTTATYDKITTVEHSHRTISSKGVPAQDPLLLIGVLTQTNCPVDRTGKLQRYNMSYDPIPKYDENFNKSYEDVVLNRAKHIWEMDDTVDVSWSGGVDSTAVCCAMVLTKPANKKLRIICTESIERENPECFNIKLFKEFIVKESFAEFLHSKKLNPPNTILTGEPGTFNHVGGVDTSVINSQYHTNYNVTGQDITNLPWIHFWKWQKQFLGSDVISGDEINLNNAQKMQFSQLLQEHFKQAPFEIKTMHDMRWWLMFTFRTNWAKYCLPLLILTNSPIRPEKISLSKWVSFYNCNEMQLWNIAGHVKKTKDAYPYKWQAKNFIKNTIQLDNFIDSLQKYTSLWHINNAQQDLIRWRDKNFVVLDDGRVVTIDNLSVEMIEDIVNY
jgi:hypothetical protein